MLETKLLKDCILTASSLALLDASLQVADSCREIIRIIFFIHLFFLGEFVDALSEIIKNGIDTCPELDPGRVVSLSDPLREEVSLSILD